MLLILASIIAAAAVGQTLDGDYWTALIDAALFAYCLTTYVRDRKARG